MDGISIYANWVSRVVLPIAFQWIHERETVICENNDWKRLPDDVGKVVQAAFAEVQKENYYKECRDEFERFLWRAIHDPLTSKETEKINCSWTETSARLRKEVFEELNWEREPVHS